MAEVSIVLPVYNVDFEQFHQCVDSIRKQTFQEYEAILVDDGSTNGVEILCDDYVKRDKRFKVIHQKNKGLPAARNAGTKVATGRWIIYCDSDDWWEKNTLEVLCEYMREKDLEVLVFAYFDNFPDMENGRHCWQEPHPVYVQADKKLIHNMQLGLLDESIRRLTGYFGSVCIQIHSLTFLRQHHLVFNEKMGKSEDMIFNLYMLDVVKKLGILDIPFYHYRRHPASMCHHYDGNIEKKIGDVEKELYRFCQSKPKEYKDAYHVFMIKNYWALLRLKYFHTDNPDSEREKRQQWKRFIQYHEGFVNIENTDMKLLLKKRKIMAILYFVSFKMRSYFLLKVILKVFKWIKKE